MLTLPPTCSLVDLNSALKEELQRLRFFTMVSLMGKQSLNSSKGRRTHSLLTSPSTTSIPGVVSINGLEPLSMYMKFMDELITLIMEALEKEYTKLNYGMRALCIDLPGFAFHKAYKVWPFLKTCITCFCTRLLLCPLGYLIPKGWKVFVWYRAIHQDPQVYPNRRIFDPSRFDTPGKAMFLTMKRHASFISEVTLERAVLVHSIIKGLDVKAELLITENISAATKSKDETKRLPFPSIIYRLLYTNGIKKIDGDELIPIERPITAESMTKNKYLEMQQEIQQQIPQPPPQFQQEQVQHDQTLPQEFNWQELNQQFQGIQNFQEQQRQLFEDFGKQQKLYKQEFQDLRVQQHQYHQELQNQQALTNKVVQELKKLQDKHYKEFLAHKKELQKQYQRDHEEYITIANHQIEFRKRTDLK
ncbi:hypothetical protein PIB30_047822 [Stylosanthes scabra]|uniref:Uncharacterized protein n=1 Tax=Stylosanthes scabra TaxID=79078 RepID=A0ABU6ZFM0_9FABA|nr:hypothetical protein [Stylosanthes scabra]